MTYAQNNEIQATDFDNLVGSSTSTTTTQLNCLWGTGVGSYGYGQTPVPQVSADNVVYASDWGNLITTTNTIASHQGTAITKVSAPTSGSVISYVSLDPTNVATVLSAHNNAVAQSAGINNSTAVGTTWSNTVTFTQTVTFSSGDAARYFFNAGGQIKIQCLHAQTSGTAINQMFQNMASAMGTLVLSASTSQTIVGTAYTGTTQIGGTGGTVNTSINYYNLTTSYQQIFNITPATSPTGYASSHITVSIKSSGASGSHGDTGNVITIQTIWSELPYPTYPGGWAENGLLVQVGTNMSTTSVTAYPPSASYISPVWGTPTVSGSVTGN